MRQIYFRWRHAVIPGNPSQQSDIDTECDFVKLPSGESIVKGESVGSDANDSHFIVYQQIIGGRIKVQELRI